MTSLISTRSRRLCWTVLVFLLVFGAMIPLTRQAYADPSRVLTDGEFMNRFLLLPALAAVAALSLLSACAPAPTQAVAPAPAVVPAAPPQPFMAQVVGLQWLNPLQRRDYPTEWQLLWTLGLVKPNKDDDMVRTEPEKYSKLQMVSSIAVGNGGEETFQGYHEKYIDELIYQSHDIYFSSSRNFYNAHSLKDKTTWRELAGIHVEYALPEGKLDPVEATSYTRDRIVHLFAIG